MNLSTVSPNFTSPAIVLVTHGACPPQTGQGRAVFELDLRERFPGHELVWSEADRLGQTLERAVRSGMSQAALLPLLVQAGATFARIQAQARAAQTRNPGLQILTATPLLAAPQDIADLAQALLEEESNKLAAQAALLLIGHGVGRGAENGVGHGGGRSADGICRKLQEALQAADPRFLVISLGDGPELATALRVCKNRGVAQLVIAPLLVSAGLHWRRDICGPAPQSVRSRLAAQGFSVAVAPETLLERPGARHIWLGHLAVALAGFSGL